MRKATRVLIVDHHLEKKEAGMVAHGRIPQYPRLQVTSVHVLALSSWPLAKATRRQIPLISLILDFCRKSPHNMSQLAFKIKHVRINAMFSVISLRF